MGSPDAGNDLSTDSIGTEGGDDAHHGETPIELFGFLVVGLVVVLHDLFLNSRVDVHDGFTGEIVQTPTVFSCYSHR